MFTVNDELLQNFGKELARLREENNITNKYIEKITKIDNATLSRLESGLIKKVNPFMLQKLADFYNINILTFQIMLGYISESDIIKFSDVLKNQKHILKKESASQNLKIPVIKNKEDFLNNSRHIFNLYNSKEDFLAFSKSNNKYFLFKKTNILIKDDIGIFEINNRIHIGKYAIQENFVFISDILSTDVFFREKSAITILGKVFYIIEVV